MYGLGGNAPVAGQPGIYPLPFRVDQSGAAAALTVTVSNGLAKFGDNDYYERTAATDATTVAVPDTVGDHILYINPTAALDGAGGALPSVGFVPEADIARTAINGSVGTTLGRSLGVAKVSVAAHTGTVTFAGVWAADDTATVTVGGNAVVLTVTAGMVAGDATADLTAIAAAMAAALTADTAVAALVTVTSALGVVTLTSKTAVAHALVAAEVTAGSGTATRSAATLTGGGISAVDNTYRFKTHNKPRGREIR